VRKTWRACGQRLFTTDRLIGVIVLHIAEGAVQSIRAVVNPDKLQHLGPLLEFTRLRR
jgi:RNA polymerase sigma-70 factor, ECF subfamily